MLSERKAPHSLTNLVKKTRRTYLGRELFTAPSSLEATMTMRIGGTFFARFASLSKANLKDETALFDKP
eukprot:10436660-Karenia_brevis.AAC.1